MSVNVSPGPLPDDGTRFNPEVDLAALVNGTRVFDFGVEEFTDSGVAFIVSQTDAPASASVNRGLSWFARGEGVLYHAHFFTPIEGARSGVTDFRWVAASGSRKEQIVEYRFPIRVVGGVVRQTGEAYADYGVQLMANRFMMPRVMQTIYTSHTDMSLTSDAGASYLGFWSRHHNDPIYVALDTTGTDKTSEGRTIVGATGWSGHDFHTVVECGFCQVKVADGYAGPGKLVLSEGINEASFRSQTNPTFAVEDVECAYALDSGATDGGLALAFLRPSVVSRNF